MEEEKALEIDLRNYIQSYLEDEYLADMEYKGKTVTVEIENPVVQKRDNNVYCIVSNDADYTKRETTHEKRDSSASRWDSYHYCPVFYLKECEYSKLKCLTKKLSITGIAASFDKNAVTKREVFKTVSRWLKKVKIKDYDEYSFEIPFKDCTISPIMETYSLKDWYDHMYYGNKGYICRCSVVVSEVDNECGSFVWARARSCDDNPEDDCFDAIVRFNFVSTTEKEKVKNLSVGDAVVIELKCNDSCELYDCHIVS